MPTFIIFEEGKVMDKVKGADPRKLQEVVKKLAAQAEGGSSYGGSSSRSSWRIGELPRGYGDVTDQVELKGLEMLNSDDSVRVLIGEGKPSGLQKGKATTGKDWVESDTDEQLMLFMPFQATLKIHTLQVSLAGSKCTSYTDPLDHVVTTSSIRRRRR
jgi:hypothetical protein